MLARYRYITCIDVAPAESPNSGGYLTMVVAPCAPERILDQEKDEIKWLQEGGTRAVVILPYETKSLAVLSRDLTPG